MSTMDENAVPEHHPNGGEPTPADGPEASKPTAADGPEASKPTTADGPKAFDLTAADEPLNLDAYVEPWMAALEIRSRDTASVGDHEATPNMRRSYVDDMQLKNMLNLQGVSHRTSKIMTQAMESGGEIDTNVLIERIMEMEEEGAKWRKKTTKGFRIAFLVMLIAAAANFGITVGSYYFTREVTVKNGTLMSSSEDGDIEEPLLTATTQEVDIIDGDSIPEEITLNGVEITNKETGKKLSIRKIVLAPTGVEERSETEILVHVQKLWIGDELEIAALLYSKDMCPEGDVTCEKTGQTVDILSELEVKGIRNENGRQLSSENRRRLSGGDSSEDSGSGTRVGGRVGKQRVGRGRRRK